VISADTLILNFSVRITVPENVYYLLVALNYEHCDMLYVSGQYWPSAVIFNKYMNEYTSFVNIRCTNNESRCVHVDTV